MRFFLLAAMLAAALVAPPPANAAPISYPVDAVVYSGSLCTSFFGTCTANVLSTAGTTTLGGSTLTFGLTPSPIITASVTGGVTTGLGNPVPTTGIFDGVKSTYWDTPYVAAEMQYYAHISGPANVALPVDLAYTLAVSRTDPGSRAGAGIFLNASVHLNQAANQHPTYLVNDDQIGTYIYDANGLTPPTRTGILTDTIMSNTEFDIGIFALAMSDALGSAYASVDPVLFIDPSFAMIDPNYLTDFTLELSPGAGNTELPEPMTLALFLAGLVGVFVVIRLQRSTRHQAIRAPACL